MAPKANMQAMPTPVGPDDITAEDRLREILASPIQDIWRLHYIVMKNNEMASRYFRNCFGLNSKAWSSMYCVFAFPGITINGICEIMPRPHNSVSRAITELNKLGLIEQRPGKDKRKRHLYLTDKGKAMQQAMLQLSLARQDEIFGTLSDGELKQLRRLLDKIAFGPKMNETELIEPGPNTKKRITLPPVRDD